MTKSVVEIKKLSKKYHDLSSEIEAVDKVSFSVQEKEFISIVGPSGCGKSTILSILCGLEVKSEGDFTFGKDPIKIGYMLQKDSLFPWLTILDNCLLGLKITHSLTEEKKQKVVHLLKTYGLGDFMEKYPSSLSGGMCQRAALIRTLAIEPDILLMDEPFSALDYQSRLALSDDVYKMIKQEGKTAIMVTHDLAEAISLSDRIIVLGKRPSRVKKIYEIEMKNKSTPIHNRQCPEFSVYYDQIWRDLDVHI